MNKNLSWLVCLLLSTTCASLQAQNYIAWRSVPGTTQPSPQNRQRAEALSRESYDLIQQHDLIGAEGKLREALDLMPKKAVWHFNLACILTARGQVDGAMDSLEHATDCGFTDFTLLEADPALTPLRELPRYKQLIARKDEIRHKAAEAVVQDLKHQFGDGYLYEVDEDDKLIFATNTDQATLDALKMSLIAQAKSQETAIFSHKPDEFIRIIVPSPTDYRKMMRMPAVQGIYEDQSRTLLAVRLGQVMTHEFTHALHSADQRAAGQEHPVWLREGLASMYEAGEFVNGELVPHDNFRLGYVQSAARRSALVPLDKLVSQSVSDFIRSPNLCYGESSSLLLYLYDQKLLRKFYDTYKASYASDPTGVAALEQTTGQKLPELQKSWVAWMLVRKSPTLQAGPGGVYLGLHFGQATDGLKINMIVPASPGAKADLRAGDIIVGLDSHEVRDYASFAPLLAEHKPGDEIKLKIHRQAEYLDVAVTVGQR